MKAFIITIRDGTVDGEKEQKYLIDIPFWEFLLWQQLFIKYDVKECKQQSSYYAKLNWLLLCKLLIDAPNTCNHK